MRGTLIPITAAALRLKATAISALPSSERRRKTCTGEHRAERGDDDEQLLGKDAGRADHG